MKTNAKILTGIMILATLVLLPLFLTGCPQSTQEEQEKPQSAIINSFEDLQLTVKGTFKDSEWAGVAGKIEAAIVSDFVPMPSGVAVAAKERYAKCEAIVVEQTSDYANWKTNGDGKTIYLNYGALDNLTSSVISAALMSMDSLGPETAKVIAPVPQYNQAMVLRDNRIASRTLAFSYSLMYIRNVT